MTIASRLNLRLFIDGLEVPVIGARCSFGENADAVADVQVIATDSVFDIPARAAIHLFYYETYDLDIESGKEASGGPEDPRKWKLLFFGELAAVQLQKSEGSRQAVLQCIGPMNYLDFLRQHYLNFRNGGIEYYENAFLGVAADRIKNFDVIGKGVESNLFVWLSASKVEVENEDGSTEKYSNIYTGTQRLLREMFFAGNFFYSQAFNRLRIGDMVVGLPEDKTAAQMMKMSFFQKFIQNRIGGAGGLVTARQMLDLLLGTVFHSLTTIPCPMFDLDGKALGLDIRVDAPSLRDETVDFQVYPGSSLNYVVVKPDTWFLTPPACNIIFPHQYSALSYQRNYLAEPTRLMLRTSMFWTGKNKWLTERFYAPDFEALNEIMYREGGHLDRMAEVLMGHEEFTGLNPLFLWESDIGAYVQKGARREYLSKLADYTFWKYRFSTRTVNLSGPFNPNLIPGYPALVMDRTAELGHLTKHLRGNIQSLVHVIDQHGGQTHVTMVGCHHHDETADYDGKGRSLEEVTRRGNDGYLDSRYDPETIGDEVYQKLFGIGSLIDVVLGGVDGDLSESFQSILEGAELDTESPMLDAITLLQVLYRAVVTSGGDVDLFTRTLTQRPKADMARVIGVPYLRSEGDVGTDIFNLLSWAGYDPEGFHSVAVDNESSVDDSYTAKWTRFWTTVKDHPAEEIYSYDVQNTKFTSEIKEAWQEKTHHSENKSEETSYGLAELVEKRRAWVQRYLDSLEYTGLRG